MDGRYRHGRSRSRDRDYERNNIRENYNNDNYSRGPLIRRSRSRDKFDPSDERERSRRRQSSRSPPHQRSRVDKDFKESFLRTANDNLEFDRANRNRISGGRDPHQQPFREKEHNSSRHGDHRGSSRTEERTGDRDNRHHHRHSSESKSSGGSGAKGGHVDDNNNGKRNRADEGVSRTDSHTSRNRDRTDSHTKATIVSSTAKVVSSKTTNTKENNDINNRVIPSVSASQESLTPSCANGDDETAENTKANAIATIQYNESELKDIEAFLEFGANDEDEEARETERLAAERRKRLEAIANKHKLQQQQQQQQQQQLQQQQQVSPKQRKLTEVEGDSAQEDAQPPTKRKLSSDEDTFGHSNLNILDDDASQQNTNGSLKTAVVDDAVGAASVVTTVGVVGAGVPGVAGVAVSADGKVTMPTVMSLEHLALDDHLLMQKKARELKALQNSSVSSDSNDRNKNAEATTAVTAAENTVATTKLTLSTVKPANDDDDEEGEDSNLNILSPVTSPTASTAAAATLNNEDEGRHLAAERSAVEEEEKRNKSNNYFAFDMFSSSPSDLERLKAGGGGLVGGKHASREALLAGEGKGPPGLAFPVTASGFGEDHHHLQSNWDDGEGYYKARIGEVIADRYHTLGVVGKGVFSTVLKCVDLRTGDGKSEFVAIKMIRNNDTMRRAAEKEKSILLAIIDKDPENKRFCVRLLTHFDFRHHVALVFEYQQMNLREALKKFGKDVGINIGAVRMYGKQLMIALRLLMEIQVVHADIKLDNILCSGDLKQVKLCDFGSAFRETDTDNDPTPYLVSRFYRAPEIILGMPYDRAIDLWSVCVCLYELFTGHVMFPGRTNNEMLRLSMAVKGRFPNKLIKAHIRQYEIMSLEPHFDNDCRFKQYEVDSITGKTVLRMIDVTTPTRDLETVLRGSKAGADDLKLVSQLTDLLEKGLTLDPSKRLTVSDALRHPFFQSTR